MRVTTEDGVYDLLEVKIEFMFDNGKGRMVQRNDIFLVREGMRGNLVGLELEQVNQDHKRKGVERRVSVNYGMEKNYESWFLRVDRLHQCNSPPINGQCTNFVLFDVAL